MAVSDYPNGQAPRSEMVFRENMWMSHDMARRILWAFGYIRANGGRINGTQGYRWLGIPSDRYVGRGDPDETNASQTSDGTGNQWYQKGREDAGYTPSAATPGYSNHGRGLSVDTNTDNLALRDEAFALVGLRRDIASETWHATVFRDPQVDLSAFADLGNATPIETPEQREERELMAAKDEIISNLTPKIRDAALEALKAKLYRVKDGPQAGDFIAFNRNTGVEWKYGSDWQEESETDKGLGLVGVAEEFANITAYGLDRLRAGSPKR